MNKNIKILIVVLVILIIGGIYYKNKFSSNQKVITMPSTSQNEILNSNASNTTDNIPKQDNDTLKNTNEIKQQKDIVSNNINNSTESQQTNNSLNASQNNNITKLPSLLDLGSTTCIPCQQMMPILDEVAKEYTGKVNVRFINVYEEPSEVDKYKISVIPTQILLDASGKEVYRHEGVWPKEEIIAKFKEIGVK